MKAHRAFNRKFRGDISEFSSPPKGEEFFLSPSLKDEKELTLKKLNTNNFSIMSEEPFYKEELRDIRRRLRSGGTPAEGKLWTMLKNRQVGGLRFRRQVSVDNFVLDFYCPEIKLAIELDGAIHYHADSSMRDYERSTYLQRKYGIKVIRFENKEIFDNPQRIIRIILDEIKS